LYISKSCYGRFLSTGISFRQLSFSLRINKSAVASAVKETTCAVWTAIQARHMPSPKDEMFKEIAKDFHIHQNFPNCTGNIGGKHIRIKCAPNCSSQHFKYKQYHSIVLQAVVDAYLKFVTVFVGAYGKQSNGGFFHYSVSELGNMKFEIA
jgi:hypothetical protein